MCTGCVTLYFVPHFGSKVSPIQSIPIIIEKFWVFIFVIFFIFIFIFLYVNCVNFNVHRSANGDTVCMCTGCVFQKKLR